MNRTPGTKLRFSMARARDAASAARTQRRLEAMDQFAELLAEGRTIQQAQAEMGISRNSAERYIRDIRRALGPQAV